MYLQGSFEPPFLLGGGMDLTTYAVTKSTLNPFHVAGSPGRGRAKHLC